MTVCSWVGITPLPTISTDSPRNITARITAIVTSVAAALRDSGGLKAGMPLEIASVPVMTAEPTVKARSSRNSENASVTGGSLGVRDLQLTAGQQEQARCRSWRT